MAEIKDAALQSLQEAFQEVAFRANRLREWMALDSCFRALAVRFGDFNQEVESVVGPPPVIAANSQTRLRQLWNRCKETELVDLQVFTDGVRHINRSSWRDANGGTPPLGGRGGGGGDNSSP